MNPDPSPSPSTRRPAIQIIACLLLIGVVQIWIASSGYFNAWPTYTSYYSRLTQAFLQGQLSLLQPPDPRLLALPDPYDSDANIAYRLHDAILYNGKFYVYWGPVPAILAAGICRVAGIDMPTFGDQYLVFLFSFGTTVAAAVLLLQARSRLFPQLKPTATLPGILTLGLGTPLLCLDSYPAVYEAAIAAGQCFLLMGISVAWSAFNARGARRSLLLLLAGICWTLSAGSRVSLWPAIGIITLLAAWRLWRMREPTERNWPGILAGVGGLFIPLMAGAALTAWYNYARFHSFTDFGLRYQLAIRSQHTSSSQDMFGIRNVIPNLYYSIMSPPRWTFQYPFVWAWNWRPWMADVFHLPSNYYFYEIVGLLWCQPFLLLMLGMLRRRAGNSRTISMTDPRRWLTLTLAAGAVLGFLPSLAISSSAMRYLVDVVPCCVVLATLGYFHLLVRFDSRPRLRRELRAAVRYAVALQTIMAILLAWDGFHHHL